MWRTPHNGNGIHFSIGSGIHTGMVANGGRELGSSGYYGGGYEFSIKSSSSSTSTRTSTNSGASTITPSSPSSKRPEINYSIPVPIEELNTCDSTITYTKQARQDTSAKRSKGFHSSAHILSPEDHP